MTISLRNEICVRDARNTHNAYAMQKTHIIHQFMRQFTEYFVCDSLDSYAMQESGKQYLIVLIFLLL